MLLFEKHIYKRDLYMNENRHEVCVCEVTLDQQHKSLAGMGWLRFVGSIK